VIVIALVLLALIGVTEGWKMVLVTIGLATALLGMLAFIHWYLNDA